MHNDPGWAAQGPWGGTIAHGFFLLSLLSYFHGQAGFPIVATDDQYVVNYGPTGAFPGAGKDRGPAAGPHAHRLHRRRTLGGSSCIPRRPMKPNGAVTSRT